MLAARLLTRRIGITHSKPTFAALVDWLLDMNAPQGGISDVLKKLAGSNALPSTAEARRSPLRLQFPKKNTHQHSVIADAAQAFQFRQSLPAALGRSKRTLGGHVDVGIGNRQDSCPLRNLLTLKAARIAGPVDGLVVMLN